MSRAHPQSFRAWLMEDVYSLSSTQINLPDPLDDFLIKWGRMNIPDENLHFDEDGGLGRETEPHITVLYGLKEQEPSKELLELLQRTKPFTVRLGKVSLFESEKYDVVKFEVISDDLVELSNAIRVACPNENKFPKYIPHATVAYCKKGTVADLAGQYPFEASPPIPNEFEASEIVFSGAGDSENPKRLRKILPFNRYRKESVGALVPGAARDFLAKLQTPNWVVYTESSKYPGGYSYFKRILAPGGAEPRTYTWVVDPREAERFDNQAQAEQAISEFYRFPNPFFGIKVGKLPVQEAREGSARDFLKTLGGGFVVRAYTSSPPVAVSYLRATPEHVYDDSGKGPVEWGMFRRATSFPTHEAAQLFLDRRYEKEYQDRFRMGVCTWAEARPKNLGEVQEAKEGDARSFLKSIDPWSYEVEEDHDYLKPPAFAGPKGYHALLCWHGKPQGSTRTYEDRSKAEAEAKAYISKFKKLDKVLPYAAHIESYAHLWNWYRAAVNAEPIAEAEEGSARDFLKKLRGQNITCPLAKWPEDKQLIIQTHDRVDVGNRTTLKAWYEAFGRYRVLVMLDHQITEVGPSGVFQLPNGDFRLRQDRRDGTKAERVVRPDEVVIAVHGPARARTNPDLYAVDVLPARSRLGEAQPGAARAFLSKLEIPKYVICALHQQDSTAAPLYASMGRDNAWTDWRENLDSATRFSSKEEAQAIVDGKFSSFEQAFNRIGVVTYAYARCHFVRPPQQHESAQHGVEAALERSIGQELPFKLVPVGATFKHEGDVFQRRGTDNKAWNWLKGGWTSIGDNEVVGPVDNQYSPFDKVGFPEDSSVLTRKLGKR